MLSQLVRKIRGLMATLRMPPFARIMRLATGYRISRALYVVTKLGIADLLKDGPKLAEELAAATQSNADALFRVMRVLAVFEVFAEVGPRSFGLTPLSEILRSDPPRLCSRRSPFYIGRLPLGHLQGARIRRANRQCALRSRVRTEALPVF